MMEYFLKQIEFGDSDPIVLPLDSKTLIVGKASIPGLANYPKVSRNHAKLKKVGNDYFIKSLSKKHGVYINGKPIAKRFQKLEIGDVVGFGSDKYEDTGFICTFCMKKSTLQLKKEPIELVILSDDDASLDSGTSLPTQHCEEEVNVYADLPDENSIEPVYASDNVCESVPSIEKFLQAPFKRERRKSSESDSSANSDVSLHSVTKEPSRGISNVNYADDFSSSLENGDDSDVSLHSDIIVPTKYKSSNEDRSRKKALSCNKTIEDVIDRVYQKIKPSKKTAVIGAKPIEKRPLKVRGREEWFETNEPRNINKNSKQTCKPNSFLRASGTNLKSIPTTEPSPSNFESRLEKLKRIELNKSLNNENQPTKKKGPTVKLRNFAYRSEFLTNLPTATTPMKKKESKRVQSSTKSKKPPNNNRG